MLANTAGVPVTGLQAYFYAAGTLNPEPVFQDSALAIEHIQPVTVDDAGRLPPIWLTQNLAYRIQLKDQFGAVIENGDIDNYIENQFVLSSSQIATTLDSLKRTAAEIAAGVAPINYAYAPGDLRRYGADPTGSNNSVAAVNAALAQSVASGGVAAYAPGGEYLIGSQVSVPAHAVIYGDGRRTVFMKGFNGDVFNVASFARLSNFDIDGDSANWTGRGIVIDSGTNPSGGRQKFFDIHISNTASYNVEYVGDGVGFLSKWIDCEFLIPTEDDVAIKLPTDTNTGNRLFVNCNCPSSSMIDIGDSHNTMLQSCTIGRSVDGPLSCIVFGTGSAQCIVIGCRLAGGNTTMTILGLTHTITGCTWAGDVEFGSGCIQSKFVANQNEGSGVTIADNSGSSGTDANEFDSTVVPYQPTWTGATSNPSLGNGSLNGSYTRRGRVVLLSFRLVIGSTTTFGTGEWRFSLPFKSHSRSYLGSVKIFDSGTEIMGGFAQINEGGATFLSVYGFKSGVVTGLSADDTHPITWTTSDELWVSITYDA
jgi:hypothetical protein